MNIRSIGLAALLLSSFGMDATKAATLTGDVISASYLSSNPSAAFSFLESSNPFTVGVDPDPLLATNDGNIVGIHFGPTSLTLKMGADYFPQSGSFAGLQFNILSGTPFGSISSTHSSNPNASIFAFLLGDKLFVDLDSNIFALGDTVTVNFALPVAAVPEPSTWAMMVVGFCGLGWLARRRSKPLQRAA